MKKTKFLLMTFLLSLFSMVGYAQADLVIQDLNDLKAFRDAVNAGDNFGGKVVELTADINLAEVENWVPIGDGTLQGNYGFSGTFEGNGHTISNLKCTNKKYGGLFGRFYGTVQNLTVENVNITTNHWAGGIVAYEDHEKGQLSVNNCTVDGGTITCLVEGEEGSYDNGDKVGGIIGALQTNDKVTNCTVKNLTIQGYRDVGGIAGYAGNASVVTGNKVTDVTIIQDMTKFYGAPDRNTAYENQKNNVGEIVGRDTGTASTEGNVATNTTIKVIPAVARYNDTTYFTLQDAIDAVANVPANEPQTIEMLMDHEIAAQTGVTIASDQNIVLDLNGFTVKVNVNEESESQVITNKGTLTITDSSEEGTGTLTNEIAEGVKADYWGYYGCDYRMNIITNKGNLTIESGTIENKDKGDTGDSGDSAFAIANDNSEGNATLIVNGGKAIAQYIAVGFLCLSETNENNIQVTGGEIRGGFSGIYTLVSGTEIYQRKGSLTISGGHVYGRYYSFTDDTPQFRNKANEVFANIKYEISGGDIESDGDENFSILCVFDDSFEGFVTGGYFKPNPGDWYSADERKFIEVEEHNGESGWWTLGTFTQLIIYDQTPSSKWTPYEELEDYWGQTVDELTYRREFAENKGTNYQSWFVPFDYTITEEAAEKFDFYKIHMVAASKDEGVIDNNSEEEVWMYIYQAPAGTTLHGNRPYIIKAKEAGTLYDFVLKDVYMMPETDVSTLNVSTSHYNYDFFGTYHEVHPEGKWFTLNVDGLLKWNANQVRGYRWYVKPTLKLGEDEYADITFVIVEEGDDTNSVTKVHGDTKVEMEGIYTVDGIKLSQPVKGVNIMKFSDGSIKKVFIK